MNIVNPIILPDLPDPKTGLSDLESDRISNCKFDFADPKLTGLFLVNFLTEPVELSPQNLVSSFLVILTHFW